MIVKLVRTCTLSLSERIRPKWERANRQRIAAQLGVPRPSDRPRPRSGVVGTRRGGSGLAVEAPCGAVVAPRTAGIGAKALLNWQAGMVALHFGCPRSVPAIRLPQQKPAVSCQGPMVRIHLPPAESLRARCSLRSTTCSRTPPNTMTCAVALRPPPRAAQGSTRH